MTRSSVQAMRMTHFLESRTPSTWTTWWTSSHTGRIGQILQNLRACSRNVLALVASSDWGSFPGGHDTKDPSRLDVVSFLTTLEPPQALHRHLCVPALANPFFFMDAPQMLHFLIAAAYPRPKPTSS